MHTTVVRYVEVPRDMSVYIRECQISRGYMVNHKYLLIQLSTLGKFALFDFCFVCILLYVFWHLTVRILRKL